MAILILGVGIYVGSLALMLAADWITGGVIADAFGKDWPYARPVFPWSRSRP